jgi:isochorismate hydrolase
MPGIPSIDSYTMPTSMQLPQNIVDWKIDPQKAVLLIHDMQQYFVRRFPSNSFRTTLINNIASIRNKCIKQNVPVAYTMQTGDMSPSQRGLLKDFWGDGMKASVTDKSIVDGLVPNPDDWTFSKWRYSAFYKTKLLEKMHESEKNQLIICGVYAHIGILATAVDAFSNDIQTFLVSDGIADFSESKHQMTLDYSANCCAVVLPSSKVLI